MLKAFQETKPSPIAPAESFLFEEISMYKVDGRSDSKD